MSSQSTTSIGDPTGPDSTLDQRTNSRDDRAHSESMDVALLEQGGIYTVTGESDQTYRVDIMKETCSCLDYQQREPDNGCKHLRRVNHDLEQGFIPRPDGKLPTALLPIDSDDDRDATTPADADYQQGRVAIRDAIRAREEEIARLQSEIDALQFVSDTLETIADPDATFSLDDIQPESR